MILTKPETRALKESYCRLAAQNLVEISLIARILLHAKDVYYYTKR